MEVKLYVGNLSYSTTEADLKSLFAKAGQVAAVTLIKDQNSGVSKGYAFVEMNTQVEAEEGIRLFNGFDLDNRELKVNLAKPRARGQGRSDRYGRGKR